MLRVHQQILQSRSVNVPLWQKSIQESWVYTCFITEPTNRASALCLLTGTPGNLFPRAVWKSHFQTPHRGRCKWLYYFLLFSSSSAFGWCIIQRGLGLNAVWSISNNPDAARGGTKVPSQWTRETRAHIFYRYLGGFLLWLLGEFLL